jgi:hypothetical protein
MKKEINIEIKKVWWDICTPEGYPLKEKRDMEIIFFIWKEVNNIEKSVKNESQTK